MPFSDMKARNSSLVKEEPLSVRTFCGRLTPCNVFGGRDRLHHVDVEPFGVGVHDDQKNVAYEGSCEIKLQSAPWLRGPLPGVKGGNSRGRAGLLTHRTRFDEIVNLCIHSGPPYVVGMG